MFLRHRVIFPIGYEPCLKRGPSRIASVMPSIFLRYGSWLVTGMTLVMSLITAVMVTAISGTVIVEEDELLQFAVDSEELIICRMLDVFQFSYVCIVTRDVLEHRER
jgi:hypothetical protein